MTIRYLKILIFLLRFSINYCVTNDFCGQLSEKTLSVILGQAFNPRYMSIVFPEPSKDDDTVSGYKRSSYDIQFYGDKDIVSVGDLPAWEADHYSYFEKQMDESLKKKDISTRNVFLDKLYQKSKVLKSRPWECTSKINWIDLGINYFPRYIRSIECTSNHCWYGHFSCKPKSFTIKVLRRMSGNCVRVSDKLVMLTSDKFDVDYTELWIWEEMPINFCCECVMHY